MKKLLSILLICVMCVSFSGCASTITTVEELENDNQNKNQMDGVFRYANWGDTIEMVEKKETNIAALKSKTSLMYKEVKLLNHNTTVLYYFEDGGFNGGVYSINDIHTNENMYIDDFYSINKVLTQKYGEPLVNIAKWTRDVLKDDPGLALYYGDVTYYSNWKSDNIIVSHKLSSDNFTIEHTISYLNPSDTVETDTSGL